MEWFLLAVAVMALVAASVAMLAYAMHEPESEHMQEIERKRQAIMQPLATATTADIERRNNA